MKKDTPASGGRRKDPYLQCFHCSILEFASGSVIHISSENRIVFFYFVVFCAFSDKDDREDTVMTVFGQTAFGQNQGVLAMFGPMCSCIGLGVSSVLWLLCLCGI